MGFLGQFGKAVGKTGMEVPERVPFVPPVIPEIGRDEHPAPVHLGAERLHDAQRLRLVHALLPRQVVAIDVEVEPAVVVRHHTVRVRTLSLQVLLKAAARVCALVAADHVAEAPRLAGGQGHVARQMRRHRAVFDLELGHRMLHARKHPLRRKDGDGAVRVAAAVAVPDSPRRPIAEEADVVDLDGSPAFVPDGDDRAPVVADRAFHRLGSDFKAVTARQHDDIRIDLKPAVLRARLAGFAGWLPERETPRHRHCKHRRTRGKPLHRSAAHRVFHNGLHRSPFTKTLLSQSQKPLTDTVPSGETSTTA